MNFLHSCISSLGTSRYSISKKLKDHNISFSPGLNNDCIITNYFNYYYNRYLNENRNFYLVGNRIFNFYICEEREFLKELPLYLYRYIYDLDRGFIPRIRKDKRYYLK